MLHDSMPYDPIQGLGQDHGGLKVARMADDFKVSPLLVCMQLKEQRGIMILQDNI